MISTCSDGVRDMTGLTRGVVCRIASQVSNKNGFSLIWIWCETHQFDLLGRQLTSAHRNENIYSSLTTLTGYFRCWQNLINRMKFKRASVACKRCLLPSGVLKRLACNRSVLLEYLDATNLPYKPTLSWWIPRYFSMPILNELDLLLKTIRHSALLF